MLTTPLEPPLKANRTGKAWPQSWLKSHRGLPRAEYAQDVYLGLDYN